MSDAHLQSLHTALVDVREGYRKGIEKADDRELRDMLLTIDGLHAAAHADVHRVLDGRGERPDDDGSLMGTVHKTVITARAAIVGLDEGSLDAFASGEENTLEHYDEAIAEETDTTVKAMLAKHRAALASGVARMKQAAASAT
jgi:uncharacterized protein (TIGR02284 family)